jgi:lysophospholipase L1-like esterase
MNRYTSEQSTVDQLNVLAVGDSWTVGNDQTYAHLAAEDQNWNLQVVGQNGGRTHELIDCLHGTLPVDVAVVFSGINDCGLNPTPLEALQQDYEDLLQALPLHSKVVVATLPARLYFRRPPLMSRPGKRQPIKLVNTVILEAAERHDAAVLDLRNHFNFRSNMMPDRTHTSQKGQKRIGQKLVSLVEQITLSSLE